MDNKYEDRLGTEPMLRLILKMSLPAVAAQIINLLYNIVDRIYIGHIPIIGTDALAGIGITSSIIILISAFSSIVGAGGAPLASIALGKSNREKAEKILGNGFTLLLIFTALICIGCYMFMNPILFFAGASDNTISYAKDYLSIYLAGTLFVQISTGLNTFINAQGRPSIAMWAVIIGAIINIILDPVLIFGFNMGVKGAAIATVISQGVSAWLILRFLLSDEATLKLRYKDLKLNRKIFWPIIGLGISPFVMASTETFVGFTLNGSLKGFGDIYISALAIMQTAMQFASVPLIGFAQGFVPVMSYNYGHGNMIRMKECCKIAITIMFSFNFILIIFIILFPSLIASAFTNDIYLIKVTREYMPLFLAGMTIFGLQRACQNMFVALGKAKISIFIALLRKVILLIPFAIFLPNWFGVQGIFAAEAISDTTAAICCTIIFAYSFPKILKTIK